MSIADGIFTGATTADQLGQIKEEICDAPEDALIDTLQLFATLSVFTKSPQITAGASFAMVPTQMTHIRVDLNRNDYFGVAMDVFALLGDIAGTSGPLVGVVNKKAALFTTIFGYALAAVATIANNIHHKKEAGRLYIDDPLGPERPRRCIRCQALRT